VKNEIDVIAISNSWEEVSRRREFLECRLTPAEREVVLLLVKEGLDNEEIARRLGKAPKPWPIN